MPEVAIAEAMEQAQATVDAEAPIEEAVDTESGEVTQAPTEAPVEQAAAAEATPTTEATPPTQRELFPPPPFDYEKAFEAIAIARQRVSVARTVMEDAKDRATAAKKRYDSAVRDLTVEIEGFEDRQHRHANEVAAIERKQAAAAAEQQQSVTTEGGEEQMSETEETQDLEQEPEPTPATPEDPPTETSSDAPGD